MPHRIVYVSTLEPGVGPPDVDAIARRSEAANARKGITGMLAVEEGRVCQILEGPEPDVDELFESIRVDPRHRDVVLLDRRPVDAPHFGGWNMARRRMVDVVTLAFTI